ncbi:MAG: hypothetical protein C0497_00425 [Gemmatimonas sp.]|nr:hypothetical protein [Gemmatimonas sp.]
MQDYRKLDVWTKSHELALDVYRMTARPHGDMADAELRTAVRQAAVCVPVLIVRGCEGETATEFSEAMREAALATDEFAYLLRLAHDAAALEDVPYARLEARTNQLRAMLGALNRTVRLKLGAEARRVVTQAPTQAPTRAATTRVAATPAVATTQAAVARAMRDVRNGGSSPPRSRP